MNTVFLDTSYAVGLAVDSDQFHPQAKEMALRVEQQNTRCITTWAVMLEIGNALSKIRHRPDAVKLLEILQNDPAIEMIPLTAELLERAVEYFSARGDKEWSLTDCISFLVMTDFGLQEALTADDHFEQAGFRALLREK